MNAATLHDTIDLEALRVGMYIHLDGGWMSHPFPLSSFRIASDEQIATIRSLGIRRVRWSRAQSDPTACTGGGAANDPVVDTVAAPPAAASPPAPPTPPTLQQRLAAQRAALQLCERQFAEAARECRQLTDLALQRPREARESAEALVSTLSTKMLGPRELCIRLLTEAAGDKASKHALNVTVVSMLMGRTFGLSDNELQDLGVGALLHDIGKLELPVRVRFRDEHSSGAEARFYEDHVNLGIAFAKRMGMSPGATQVLAQHHEHADGSGFPLRLNCDRMTLGARIVALVNRYDNLCNPHQPGAALTPHESLSLLFTQGQNKFETTILNAFIRMMGVYPAGSTVQLTDDRFALVVGVNSSRPLRPRVLVHDPKVPVDEATIVDLETCTGLGIRRCVRPAQLPSPIQQYLAPPPRVSYFFEPARVSDLAA